MLQAPQNGKTLPVSLKVTIKLTLFHRQWHCPTIVQQSKKLRMHSNIKQSDLGHWPTH